MMHLPDRPLVNPALLTTSPIRYYPDIPRNYPQRKPYVSQTFTKPSNATFSTKNESNYSYILYTDIQYNSDR